MKSETWKPVPGYDGKYEVSDKGRVRLYIAQSLDSDGYVMANLRKNGAAKTHKVHRLVLLAFVGPCPDGMEAIHRDNDKQNNRLENLCWGTHQHNQTAYGTSPIIGATGEDNPACKLTREQVDEIIRRRATGETQASIAKDFPISRRQVGKICDGTRRQYGK